MKQLHKYANMGIDAVQNKYSLIGGRGTEAEGISKDLLVVTSNPISDLRRRVVYHPREKEGEELSRS